MQLPRGTFREIRKKVILQDLLCELEETRFSGVCGIVAGPATGSFVFRNGACILARFHGKSGDAAIREMQQSARESVDVIISTLDETQVKLALEFNPDCMVRSRPPQTHDNAVPPAPAPVEHSQDNHTKTPATPPPVRPGRRVLISTEPLHAKTAHEPGRVVPRVLAHPPAEKPAPEKPAAQAVEASDDFESDIDALDTMDLDLVTSRIRSDCKTLVRHLELDHLIER